MVHSNNSGVNDYRALGVDVKNPVFLHLRSFDWNRLARRRGLEYFNPDPAKNEVESETYPGYVIRNPLTINGRVIRTTGQGNILRVEGGTRLTLSGYKWKNLGLTEEEEQGVIDYMVKYMGVTL